MMRTFKFVVCFALVLCAFVGLHSRAGFASEIIWVQSAHQEPSQCTTTVRVVLCCANDAPLREITVPLHATDWTWAFPSWSGSAFNSALARGERASEAVFDSLVLSYSPDSTEVLLKFFSTDSFLAPGTGALCTLAVLAETRHSCVGLYVDSTTVEGAELSTVDTAGVSSTPVFIRGEFDTIFDPDHPFDIVETVGVSGHVFARRAYDTAVTCTVSYSTGFYFAYRSVPIQIDAGIPGAYIVPGSVRLSEWSDSTYFDSVTVFESPDSLGLWLQFYDGPQQWCADWTCSWVLFYFDVFIPANAIGLLYIDSATSVGGTPVTSRDECPDDYPPEFGRGSITVDPASADEGQKVTPGDFVLSQPFPNPFNPDVSVSLTLAAAENVSLDVFDLLGRHVENLWSGSLRQGTYEFRWPASDQPSGVYFIRASTSAQSHVRKALLLK